jgi:hypothetical protein
VAGAGDLLGRRRVFAAGLMLFSAASLAALPAAGLPEARAAMSLVRDATAVNGEIIDER